MEHLNQQFMPNIIFDAVFDILGTTSIEWNYLLYSSELNLQYYQALKLYYITIYYQPLILSVTKCIMKYNDKLLYKDTVA